MALLAKTVRLLSRGGGHTCLGKPFDITQEVSLLHWDFFAWLAFPCYLKCWPKEGTGVLPESSETVSGESDVTLLRYFSQKVQNRRGSPFLIYMYLPDNH